MDHPFRTYVETVNGRDIFYDSSLQAHVVDIPKVVQTFVQKRPEYHQPIPEPEEVLTPRLLPHLGTLEEVRKLAREEEDGALVRAPRRKISVDEGL